METGARSERVHVAVRIRPFLETDPDDAQLTSLMLDNLHLAVGEKRVFRVDRVYGMSDESDTIYSEMVSPLVTSFVEGYSATVMAYGQTGSGKTFTMSGLIPEVLAQVVRDGGHGRTEGFSFQCLEVYGDVIRDLFSANPEASSANVRLYEGSAEDLVLAPDHTVQLAPRNVRQAQHPYPYTEDSPSRGVHVLGARRLTARSLSEMMDLVDAGAAVRATASTKMNAQSSRSHSIFTIFHEARGCKLHLVDLAGSERNKKTLNVGRRFQESVAINTGLFALGNVIRALARRSEGSASSPVPTHIPYRSGKLTRLLQDALGGHSKTLFIACVAPDGVNQEETLRTAQYCSLAMKILNAPIREYDQLRRRQTPRSRSSSCRRTSRLHSADLAQDGRRHVSSHDCLVADQRLAASEEQCGQLLQEVEVLHDELRCTYEHVDACEQELATDACTFQDQIAAMEALLAQNHQLTDEVQRLTQASSVDRAHRSTNTSPVLTSPGPVPALTASPTPPDVHIPTPRARAVVSATKDADSRHHSTVALAGAETYAERPRERWSSPPPPPPCAASIYDSLSASSAQALHASAEAKWTGGVVHREMSVSPDDLVQLQRHRDEQMMLLAREALEYQRHNADLRSKLSAMVTLVEAHKRESALLRLQLEATQDALARAKDR